MKKKKKQQTNKKLSYFNYILNIKIKNEANACSFILFVFKILIALELIFLIALC